MAKTSTTKKAPAKKTVAKTTKTTAVKIKKAQVKKTALEELCKALIDKEAEGIKTKGKYDISMTGQDLKNLLKELRSKNCCKGK